jgi:hypothetical protein
MNKQGVVLVFMACHAITASSYELATHSRITEQAFSRSSLVLDAQLLTSLGLQANSPNPFGAKYFDISGGGVQERSASTFELDKGRMSNAVDAFTIKGWLMRGSIREDDAKGEANPQDDPYNPDLRRPLHHFFDPLFNRPLTVPGLWVLDSDVHKAPDWAAGSHDVFSQPNTPEAGRRNHFSIFDAREAMYRALTGKKQDGTNAAPGASDNDPAPENVRKAYWATTFRALGDILHLNQDMAQPQHTRNEPHSGKGGWLAEELLTGHTSVLEKYIEARATGDTSYTLDGQPIQPVPLAYDTNPAYPLPVFDKYSDYWSTSPGSGSLSGKGLADYSNRGFFTPKYNYGNSTYPWPSGGTLETVFMNGALQKFLRVSVTDQYTGETVSIRNSTRSIWDDILENFGLSPTYTMTRINYDEMAGLLIPRAVAYSAGLINYFFRGKLEMSLPEEGVYGIVDHAVENAKEGGGFHNIKLKLKNATPDINAVPQDMSGGSLVLVAKFHRNQCYEPIRLSGEFSVPGSDWHGCRTTDEEIVVSDILSQSFTLTPGEEKVVWFTFPQPKPIPVNATDLFFQVVYRGKLGSEQDAVVVATKDVSEPTYVDFDNFSDCAFHDDGSSYKTSDNFLLDMEISYSANKKSVASVTGLEAGTYSRMSFITDIGTFDTLVTSGSWQSAVTNQSVSNQVVPSTGELTPVPPYNTVRAVTDPSGAYIWSTYGYGYYPTGGESLADKLNGERSSLCFPISASAPHQLTINFSGE